jgi:hypothetical protein
MVLERRAVLQSVAKVLIGLPGREPSACEARFLPAYSPRQGQGRSDGWPPLTRAGQRTGVHLWASGYQAILLAQTLARKKNEAPGRGKIPISL